MPQENPHRGAAGASVVNLAGDTETTTNPTRHHQDELWSIISATCQLEALGQALTNALDDWEPAEGARPMELRAQNIATHIADMVEAQARTIAERLTKLELAVRHG
ncbi:hypothetical protein [Sphingomonas baiyangensis]|uniref:Uncharacterized protein n=1 Tax=Sphingomonas baiyangensis TaxID=2572576 RepID=A0A4U1L6S9_9SPHN|nr:hypothetical protein [Sphingomonas baiyangensis]TKD52063.1 hypothetical protein FBR43_15970 [Sphingomonas baiyangensis]